MLNVHNSYKKDKTNHRIQAQNEIRAVFQPIVELIIQWTEVIMGKINIFLRNKRQEKVTII